MIALLLPLLLSPAPPAPAFSPRADLDLDDVEAQLGQARAHLVRRALELGAEAAEIGYFSASRPLFEFVVSLEPDNKTARKRLGMRLKKGQWVGPQRRASRDKAKPEEVEIFTRTREEFLRDAVRRVDEVFQGLKRTPALVERHRRELDLLNGIDGDNAELRKRTGYAREPETRDWVLREVIDARRNIDSNRRLLEDIRASLPTTAAADLDASVAATGVSFPTVIESAQLQVGSTLEDGEAHVIHDLVLTEIDFLSRCFELDDPEFQITSIYSLADATQKPNFFAKHPLAEGSQSPYYLSVNGCFLGRQVILSSPEAIERKDMATFLAATSYLSWNFGDRGDSGWVRQSLSSYLAAQVCGTHLSFLVTRDVYGQSKGLPWPERIPPDLYSWLAIARPLLENDQPLLKFTHALTSPTKNFAWEDVVIGYAFGAYLFEGRRSDLLGILQDLGQGKEKVSTIESALEMPMPALRERVAQWIDSMDPR